ncbi:protein kinase domain-containing protein [Streptomyces longisporoflavus]|uniref:Protein kinase n=1 Tax=Streptomyces longisporoflavus TaxID=28044 RepID=A0ABW7QTD8_9ACTN
MIGQLRDASPRRIGPYATLARLGAGGMGEVFLARPADAAAFGPADLVAVKAIRNELATDDMFRRRFRREAEVAASVDSPFVARLVASEAGGESPWLATEYVPGPNLSEAVRRHGPLPPGAVAALGAGVARALTAVHTAGALHRDLKPGNVLLGLEGPKLIDFGVARVQSATTMTRSGLLVGTPGFMSPEHVAGGRHVVAASDVFCLASVLAYAVTGRDPFGDGPMAAVLYRVSRAEAELGDMPDALRAVLSACLVRDPGERPGAAEVAERFVRLRDAATDAQWPGAVRDAVGETVREVEQLCASGLPLLPVPLWPEPEAGHPATAQAGPATAPTHPITTPAHPAPAPDHPAPTPALPAPAPDHPATAPGQQAPAPDHLAPAPDHLATAPGHLAPARENSAPAPGQQAPAPDHPATAPGHPTPAREHSAPTPDQQAPAPDRPAPSPGHPSTAPGRSAPSRQHSNSAPGHPVTPPDRPVAPPDHQTPTPGHPTPAREQHSPPAPGHPVTSPDRAIPAPGRPALSPGVPAPLDVHQLPTMSGAPPSGQVVRDRRRASRVLLVMVAVAVLAGGLGGGLAVWAPWQGESGGKAAQGEVDADPATVRKLISRAGVDAQGTADRSGAVKQVAAQRPKGWKAWRGSLGHSPMSCAADTRAIVCLLTNGTYEAVSAVDGKRLWKSGEVDPEGGVEEAYIGPSGAYFRPGDVVEPQVRGGRAVIAHDGVLQVRDSATGDVIWDAPAPDGAGAFNLRPLLDDDTLLVTAEGSYAKEGSIASLHAYDLDGGRPLWREDLGAPLEAKADINRYQLRALRDGVVYADEKGGLAAYDARTGDELGRAAGECRTVLAGEDVLCTTSTGDASGTDDVSGADDASGTDGALPPRVKVLQLKTRTLKAAGEPFYYPEPEGYGPAAGPTAVNRSLAVAVDPGKGSVLVNDRKDGGVLRSAKLPEGNVPASPPLMLGERAVYADSGALYTLPLDAGTGKATRHPVPGAPGDRPEPPPNVNGTVISETLRAPTVLAMGGVAHIIYDEGKISSVALP